MKNQQLNLESELIVSVSECLALINQTLDYAYPTISVVGEVSGFKVNQNKFVFFDIKDAEGKLGCFMMVFQLRIPLEDGMKVKVVAAPKLTKWGKFSLTVKSVTPVGEGSLKKAYELLKAKLFKEGIFSPERRRPLPRYPEKIGLISSEQAAGYGDFMKIAGLRWPLMEIETAHCRVQGEEAADDIIAALKKLNEMAKPPEVIAIVRGGGSLDDLACFNDEKLVRAVAGSRVPVIAGVGHEMDETLASLAADVTASTPSNAAELLTPDAQDLQSQLTQTKIYLNQHLRAVLSEQFRYIEFQRESLQANLFNIFESAKSYIKSSKSLLLQLDPKTVLRRGYSVVKFENQIVRGGEGLKKGDEITIEAEKVIINSEVLHVRKK